MIEQVIIGEAQAGRAAAVRSALENLIKTMEKSKFDVAELLHETKHKGYYAPYFDSFKEYVKSLNIKPRKAQYLVRIVDVMQQVGIERAKYEPLGIGKLREITSLEPTGFYFDEKRNENISLKDFIIEFVERGQEMELEAIQEHVRTLKGLVGENELTWLNISVKRSALEETIRPALELSKANIGSVGVDEDGNAVDASDGRALEMVCIEFLNDPSNQYKENEL